MMRKRAHPGDFREEEGGGGMGGGTDLGDVNILVALPGRLDVCTSTYMIIM